MTESQDRQEARIESSLNLHADRIMQIDSIEVPTTMLLEQHVKRLARRRRGRLTALALIVAGGLTWAGRFGREPRDTVEMPVAPIQSNQLVGDAARENQVRDAEELIVEQLLQVVSEQTGTQAMLVTVPNGAGEMVRAIYVPERTTPIRFQQLSPTERAAVTRVLDDSFTEAI